jgi:glycosyltransferase involved in cell wall biosynthesis
MKLAVITSHPIQYQAPLWRRLSGVQGLDMEVFYASLQGSETYYDAGFDRAIQWDVPLLEGYPWREVANRPLPFLNWRFRYNAPGIGALLKAGGFSHVLLVGKEYAYYHQALRAATRLGLKVLYRAESHPAKQGWGLERLARLSRRAWYRHVDGFLCVGHYQYRDYAAYGVGPERLFFSPYCVDNGFFAAQRARVIADRETIRRDYGFTPDTFVVGYAGKLYGRKNPLELLRAFESLPADGRRYGLLMVGDGPQKADCERLARTGTRGVTVFTGFLNQSEVSRAYVAMDAFVVPSLWETWGLALNEAMLFHLPVLATTAVNAARDLIANGENGYQYASGDVPALARHLVQVADQSAAGNPMGEASARRIRDYSMEQAASGIMEAIHATGRESVGEGRTP